MAIRRTIGVSRYGSRSAEDGLAVRSQDREGGIQAGGRPDDMLQVFYRQIREFREEMQAVATKLKIVGTLAATSEATLDLESQKPAKSLRNIREAVRSMNPDVVRSAIASIVDRIELFSKPTARKTMSGRDLHKLKIYFKSPLRTPTGTLCSGL